MDYRKFTDIDTAVGLTEYFKERAYKHTKYFHYTSLSNIKSILSNNEFWVGSVKGFNDKNDSESFGEKGDYTFSLCFSCGTTENLSLWYMYSGMDGKGGRISFNSGTLKELVENATLCLCRRKKNDFGEWKKDDSFSKPLERDDIFINLGDVLYYREEGNRYYLKYNTMTQKNFPKKEFKKFNYEGFKKKLAWYYEKEMRIVIELKESVRTLVEDIGKYQYYISLKYVEEINKKIQITLAPMIEKSEDIEDQEVREFIENRCFDSCLSEYKGEVKMRFCERCDKKCKGASCDKKGGEKKK